MFDYAKVQFINRRNTTGCQTSKIKVIYIRYISQFLLFKGKNKFPTKMFVWQIYLLSLSLWHKECPTVEGQNVHTCFGTYSPSVLLRMFPVEPKVDVAGTSSVRVNDILKLKLSKCKTPLWSFQFYMPFNNAVLSIKYTRYRCSGFRSFVITPF